MNNYTVYVTSVTWNETNQCWQDLADIDRDRIEAESL
jgi:hypothetical protein